MGHIMAEQKPNTFTFTSGLSHNKEKQGDMFEADARHILEKIFLRERYTVDIVEELATYLKSVAIWDEHRASISLRHKRTKKTN